MRTLVTTLALLGLLMIASTAMADSIVFFEEQFNGPTLDPSIWRTEVLTSGVRWCDSYPGNWWGPGTWVEEGSTCYGVAAHSPYGTATLSDGLLHISSSNEQACPYLASRRPGSIELFPASGDFTLKFRMRYDRRRPWGDGIFVFQTQSTEPSGANAPAQPGNVLLIVWADPDVSVCTALGGTLEIVAWVQSPDEFHEYTLECVGSEFTIKVDGQLVYGPVTSSLRPTAIWAGHPALAYWGPTQWGWFSLDDIRVEVPGPVPVAERTWGAVKAMYRD